MSSAMLDHVIAQVLSLQVRLLACQARLAADTDSEALHDLRIGVRRLRSLLRPLRELPGVDQLEAAAQALGTLTTPLRDREVLAAQLFERQQTAAAQSRLAHRRQTFANVAASPELARLLAIVDAFPVFLRAAQRQGLIRRLQQRIDRRLGKQWKQLREALDDPAHDRHRLRLLIKRVRYAAEAYPQLQHSNPRLQKALKRAQGDLGTWHDLLQWLLQAEQQPDLAPCVSHWQTQQTMAEQRADATLERLQVRLAQR
ncbi:MULTISPECIES: CHAD domain-containing protein [Pseudomonas]|nr:MULTISPECIES: CHAD domain-containing protein [Pseudomonas]MDF9894430.1 CHAD domain-containing protein [Pseudomonas vranovensis]MCP6692324.1 CHAD domain-containing protein [Pseudomonas donghuensis]MCP6698250.1 CHAD domain-containing protein [Pseudomonas donghuensis]PJY96447.1 CHAD domain-containing protein [Pseudomonas donghuensis]QHF29451.1 CHAD domain-containing protein [Pseudomonas sp. R32]